MEEEDENNQLPMLDMKLTNHNGQLSSTWYNKPTDTGLIMNYHSLAPKRYKRSVVSGFVYRIYVIEPLAVETGVLVDVETRGRRVGLLGLRRDGLLGRGELFEVGRHGVVRRRAALPRL